MAEPKAAQYPIPFQGQLLNTSAYEYDTKQFVGFNKFEGSYFQGCLSPLYEKETSYSGRLLFIDDDNNEWSMSNGTDILKNGNSFASFEPYNYANRRHKKEYDGEVLGAYYLGSEQDTTQDFKMEDTLVVTYFDGKLWFYTGATQRVVITVNYNLNDKRVCFKKVGNFLYVLIGNTHLIKLQANNIENYTPIYVASSLPENSATNIFLDSKGDYLIARLSDTGVKVYNTSTNTLYQDEFTLSIRNLASLDYTNKTKYLSCLNGRMYYSLQPERVSVDTQNVHQRNEVEFAWENYTVDVTNKVIKGTSPKTLTLTAENVQGFFGVIDIIPKETIVCGQLLQQTISVSMFLSHHSWEGAEKTTYQGVSKLVTWRNDTDKQIMYLYSSNNKVAGTERVKLTDNISLLCFNGEIGNISFTENKKKQGTIIDNWFSLDVDKPINYSSNVVCYISENKVIKNRFVRNTSTVPSPKSYLNRYIIVPTASGVNAFDTKTNTFFTIGTDASNTFNFFEKDYDTNDSIVFGGTKPVAFKEGGKELKDIVEAQEASYETKLYWLASSVNEQYQITGLPCSGAIFNASSARSLEGDNISFLIPNTMNYTQGPQNVNFYISELSSTPDYYCSINGNSIVDMNLAGTTYPNDSNGNALLNLCPNVIESFGTSYLLFTSVDLGNGKYCQLATIDGSNLLNYYFATVSYESDNTFVIAGQTFTVKNNIVYYSTISNGIVSLGSPIVNIGKMVFLGTLPLAALFYSEVNKTIYAFTGDTNLSELLDITRYGKPISIMANTTSQEIYLRYTDKTVVISNNSVYEVPYSSSKVYFSGSNTAFVSDKIHRVSKYKVDTDYKVIPLKVNTCFYGLQNNIVSTNDCIYIRLYNPNKEDGFIKLKAITLMNGIKETDNKEETIRYADFDKESDTFYMRFQPSLQKATSESLEIETSFAIGSMIFSNQPETSLIAATAGNGKGTHNF